MKAAVQQPMKSKYFPLTVSVCNILWTDKLLDLDACIREPCFLKLRAPNKRQIY